MNAKLAATILKGMELGETSEYSDSEIKRACDFLESVREFHNLNGDKSVAFYLINKINQLEDTLWHRKIFNGK